MLNQKRKTKPKKQHTQKISKQETPTKPQYAYNINRTSSENMTKDCEPEQLTSQNFSKSFQLFQKQLFILEICEFRQTAVNRKGSKLKFHLRDNFYFFFIT